MWLSLNVFTNLKNTGNLLFTIYLVIPYPFSSVFKYASTETGCILALAYDKTKIVVIFLLAYIKFLKEGTETFLINLTLKGYLPFQLCDYHRISEQLVWNGP